MKPHEGRKRRWGDRYDGFRVRNLDPMGLVVPYIMPKKYDSWVLFEASIELTKTEKFIREMRKTEFPTLTLYHIIFAALSRAMVDVPEMNRFVKNCRIYSRNHIKAAMVVMKGMRKDSERTIITPEFECDDALRDFVEKIDKLTGAIDKNVKVREDKNKNSFDVLEVALSSVPSVLLKCFVGLMMFLDNHGLMPKAVNRLSPFHSSFFITNMGSIGLDAVYHHIYEFGTLSLFTSIGKKEVRYEPDGKGTVRRRVYVKMQTVVDERTTDGHIYALGFKAMKRYIMNPELLLSPPENIVFDVIDKKNVKGS